MKHFIVSWTITIESLDAEHAVRLAESAMINGYVSPETEELDESEIY